MEAGLNSDRVSRRRSRTVERWGSPDASKCVLAASIDDREKDPVWITGYLRLRDKSTRQPLSDQLLTDVLFDSNFVDKGDAQIASNHQSEEVETLPIKRKKTPKEKDVKSTKRKRVSSEKDKSEYRR